MLRHDAVPVPVSALLELLAPQPCLERFALAGGTSLALRFGHRWSVDLDFFTTETFDPEALHTALGLENSVVVGRSAGSLTLDCQGTKLDFLRHGYPLLEAPEKFDDIRMLSVRDVAAMKLNAIANRGSKKDFFDLCRLFGELPLEEMLECFERKYVNTDRFIVLRSMAWFEDAEEEPDPVSLVGLSWQQVKREVRAALRTAG